MCRIDPVIRAPAHNLVFDLADCGDVLVHGYLGIASDLDEGSTSLILTLLYVAE